MRRSSQIAYALLCGGACAATALPAQAASYAVVYAFQGCGDGAQPQASLINVGGILYGTSAIGGSTKCSDQNGGGGGTVFSFDPAAGTENIVYAFKKKLGFQPVAPLLDVGGTLYSTAFSGAGNNGGTAFSVKPTTGAAKLLYTFGGVSDGASPAAGLIAIGNILYGTTEDGSNGAGNGTVFSLNRKTHAESVVYDFQDGSDGAQPSAGLIEVGGILYGTTSYGGSLNCTYGCGTIFSINPTTGVETVLYRFQGGTDGDDPAASLIAVGTTLYGTTIWGGGSPNCVVRGEPFEGCGTVFALNLTTGTESIVYSFQGGTDSAYPYGSLIRVGHLLYGTTQELGNSIGPVGGTVFSLNPATNIKTTLHDFQGGSDGSYPEAGLLNVGGTLYGTTFAGGGQSRCVGPPAGCGTIFALTP